jgi:integrase
MIDETPSLTKVIVNNGSVVVYYFHKDICRIKTGVSLEKGTNGKYTFWDYRKNYIKTSIDNYGTKSKLINSVQDYIDKIIYEKLSKQGLKLKGSELKKLIDENYKVKEDLSNKSIYDIFCDFHKKKTIHFSKKPQSLKDYTSTKNLLEGMDIYYESITTISLFNEEFCDKLVSFMKIPHPKEKVIGESIFKFSTTGNLVNDTQRKRLDILIEFKNWMVKNKITENSTFLEDTKKRIPPKPPKKSTLTIDEIHNLYDINFDDKLLNNTKDLFVMICFLGLRWSDLVSFDVRMISKNQNNELIYTYIPIKTEDQSDIEVVVPVCEIVWEILNKYNMDIKQILPNNSDFNSRLRTICKESGLFNDITTKKDKNTNKKLFRHECFTCHKGRDTFITNLVDTTPIKILMGYSGHTKTSTLMKYVDKSRNVETKYIKIFDKPKNNTI